MYVASDKVDILKIIVILIVIVAVGGSMLGFTAEEINTAIEWLVSIFISATFSIIAASLVEAVSGNILKKVVFLEVGITGKIRFSISLFLVVTLIVKYLLFDGFPK